MLVRNSFRRFLSLAATTRITPGTRPSIPIYRRWMSVDPSIEAMESFLLSSTRPNRLTVTEVISDEIVRIPSVDGIAVGSWISFENKAKGIVLHFDKSFATIGLVGSKTSSVCRNMSAELLHEPPLSFRIPSVPFRTNEKFSSPSRSLVTGVPVIDLLLNHTVKPGMTVGIYGSDSLPIFPSSESINVVEFPNRTNPPTSGIDMYLDLLRAARAAMESKNRETVLVVDFRGFENACESIQYQSGHLLPVSAQSLVASVLQLSHGSLSVIAAFNKKEDFHHEAERSVDIPIELSGGVVTNLIPLLSRFALKKQPVTAEEMLINRIVEGSRFKQSVADKEAMKMFVDFWEKEDVESFETMMRVLPGVAKLLASDHGVGMKYMLVRSMCVLPFNKTSKLNSAAVLVYSKEFVKTVEMGAHDLLEEVTNSLESKGYLEEDLRNAVDSMLYHIRYKFEITNPLV